ncbi:hypothetical protein OH717_20530 [Streptomyces albidoflavus]|uniref:Uncharacterized protein n=1 Tax=Streptomyces koyangensis TaxID=188770 RepID=A0A385DBS8_9ACTN|nr:hypothetical protein [Streptomyces koyangensis]AXQ55291.1 hypothetical protein D0C37_12220 [Streptomyces koyangensis]WTD04789.1 hypothetical protein OH717_20530 [Streptomyces albidoflavus]
MNSLASLNRRLGVLADLVARHPELPAPNVEICSVITDRITVSFHESPGAFRQWLTALGIALHTVQGGAGATCAWLTALYEVDGVTLKLTSYTRLDVAETDGAV